MSQLQIRSLSLISPKRMLARKIEFHPQVTVISGENKSGKSSLLKSIYHTFGCEVKQKDDEWFKLKNISLVNFSIHGALYWILRKENKVYLFDNQKKLIKRSEKLTDTNGAIPEILNLLKFNWTMKTRNDVGLVTDFAFTPYYIDQDTGWQGDAFESFSGVGICSNWKPSLIDYYSGIKPRDFYKIEKELAYIKEELKSLEKEQSIVQVARKKMDSKENHFEVPLCTSLDEYQKEIEELLKKITELKRQQDIETLEISKLFTEKSEIERQIRISEKAHKELEDDYNFVIKNYTKDEIPCPTCGTQFDNTMVERFTLLTDAESCRELQDRYEKKLEKIKLDISKFKKSIKNTKELYSKLSDALDTRKKQTSLKSLIKSEVRKEVDNTFKQQINEFQQRIDAKTLKSTELNKRKQALTSRARSKEIKTYFNDKMSASLDQLGMSDISEDIYKNMKPKLKAGGSDKPRLVLAFYISFLETMKEYFKPTWCPLIIDSPKQQDYSELNLPLVFDFIFNNRIPETQLILATVNVNDIPNHHLKGIKVVNFPEKRSMMTKESFKEVDFEIMPFIEEIRGSYKK